MTANRAAKLLIAKRHQHGNLESVKGLSGQIQYLCSETSAAVLKEERGFGGEEGLWSSCFGLEKVLMP